MQIKRFTVIVLLTLTLTPMLRATTFGLDDVVKARRKIDAFELNQVELLPSPFLDAQNKNSAYLLSVDPDRLISNLRKNAGLTPKADRYDGWEGQSIAGHSLGHYLSAVSKSYASTGNPKFKEISDYIVSELAEIQASSGGMLAGDSRYAEVFDQISKGDVRSQGFDLNGLWVPWYVIHKIFAGALDAYRYCDNPQALEVAKKLGDWGIEATQNLTYEQFQKMLLCEYGGTNDAYYSLYAATGDEKYLAQGDRFRDRVIIQPLSEGRDELRGRHANTQIPKIIGLARRHEVADDGETRAYATAAFFWDRVARHHSYAIGGNSLGEHFGAPDVISTRFGDSTCETCNTYNMLKLTSALYRQTGDVEYMNFFERALFNHILSSLDRDPNALDSLYTYFVPLTRGGFRSYSDRYRTWTCCHGTGMENHAMYNGEIYYREKTNDSTEVLYVNLPIPSRLTWKEKDATIELTPDGKLIVKAAKETSFVVKARVPNNCRVEGRDVADGYVALGDKWNVGETIVELPFVPEWKLEPTPDNPDVAAFFCGPILYVGDLGDKESTVVPALQSEFNDENNAAKVVAIPVVVTDSRDPNEILTIESQPSNVMEIARATVASATPNATPLVPFYEAKRRYEVYFDFFSKEKWESEREKYLAERKRALEIQRNTIDFFQPGEMQPERDAKLTSEKSFAGEHMGKKWRDARGGGWFEFDLKVDPNATCALVVTYWGGDAGNRVFDILVDGEKIAERELNNDHPGVFFDEPYEIPNPEKKSTVRVRFQGKAGATAGGIFGARSVKSEYLPQLLEK